MISRNGERESSDLFFSLLLVQEVIFIHRTAQAAPLTTVVVSVFSVARSQEGETTSAAEHRRPHNFWSKVWKPWTLVLYQTERRHRPGEDQMKTKQITSRTCTHFSISPFLLIFLLIVLWLLLLLLLLLLPVSFHN